MAHADGSDVLLETTKSPLFDNSGQIVGLLGVIRDITRQREAEQRLVESEAQYRLLAENATDVIWVMDLVTGQFKYISPSVLQLRGFTAEEALHQTMAESMAAEDMAALQAATGERLQEFLAHPESPQAYIDEIRQPCKNGQLIWVEISSRFRFNAEQQLEVFGISRNIEARKKVEQALIESEQKYRLIAENSRDMIWVLNVSQRQFKYLSPSYTLQTGFAPEEAIAGGIEFVIAPATMDRVSLDFEKVFDHFAKEPQTPLFVDNVVQQNTKFGGPVWVEYSVKCHLIDDGDIEAIGVSRVIEDRKRIEQALIESEQKYRLITENSRDMIWVLNLSQRRFTYISPSYTLQTGFTPEEAIAGGIKFVVSASTISRVLRDFRTVYAHFAKDQQTPLFFKNEVQQNTKFSNPLWVENSVKCYLNADREIEVIGVSRDIEERKQRESEILFLSTHDHITGIYNRSYFESRLKDAMERTNRYRESQALVMLDLDHFKQVNDKYGHLTGDEVLKLVVNSISRSLRSLDVFARYGGEEFVILMPETSLHGACQAADKLRRLVESNPHPIAGTVTVSCGIAEYQPGSTSDDWYRQADESLYQAKTSGRNRVVAYLK